MRDLFVFEVAPANGAALILPSVLIFSPRCVMIEAYKVEKRLLEAHLRNKPRLFLGEKGLWTKGARVMISRKGEKYDRI